jgi:hypothetical protein
MKTFFKRWAPPILGFGVGWFGFAYAEQSNLVNERYLRWTYHQSLRVQRVLVQYLCPQHLAEKFFMPLDVLNDAIAAMEAAEQQGTGDGTDQRVALAEVLKECAVKEQLEWLSDHIFQEIPYFYIGDLFNAFAELHQESFTGGAPRATGRDNDYEATELAAALWEKSVIKDVIPFEVGVRALTVLAVNNVKNAKTIAKLESSTGASNAQKSSVAIVSAHSEFLNALKEEGTRESVVNPLHVTAATVQLLLAINRARVHSGIPLFRKASSQFPVLDDPIDRQMWCDSLGDVGSAVRELLDDPAAGLLDVAALRFKCRVEGPSSSYDQNP